MKILLTGGSGMVGSNILNHRISKEYEILSPSSKDLNLMEFDKVENYIQLKKPDMIIHAAGTVGGIKANMSNQFKFMSENILMGINIISASKNQKIKKFINIGSSCMYPTDAKNPILEENILKGGFEPTNEGYALAKVANLKLCHYVNNEDKNYLYKTVIPCNLYGKYDKFDINQSHLVPSAILKLHLAKKNNLEVVDIWGDGLSRREFMYAEDFADFVHFAVQNFQDLPININVGLGFDYSVNEYYKEISDVIGFNGEFNHDLSKPSGIKQKLIDISKLKKLGWQHKTPLHEGIVNTYDFFLKKESE